MGGNIVTMKDGILHGDTKPDPLTGPKFDPMLGFPNGRKEREMHVTKEELDTAGVPFDLRDYCAHLYIPWRKCHRQNSPFYSRCDHLKHEYDQCEYEDFILRMKEYERERRLLEREKRRKSLKTESLEE